MYACTYMHPVSSRNCSRQDCFLNTCSLHDSCVVYPLIATYEMALNFKLNSFKSSEHIYARNKVYGRKIAFEKYFYCSVTKIQEKKKEENWIFLQIHSTLISVEEFRDTTYRGHTLLCRSLERQNQLPISLEGAICPCPKGRTSFFTRCLPAVSCPINLGCIHLPLRQKD